MFQLSQLEHTLRLKPDLLSLPINEAIKGELEALFLDKVFKYIIFFFLFMPVLYYILTDTKNKQFLNVNR